MLYKYNFINHHKMITLNKHFLYFIRKIRNVAPDTVYDTRRFFYSTFLNEDGRISPNNRIIPSLEVAFQTFFETFKNLNQDDKDEFYNLVKLSNNIHKYFEDSNVDLRSLRRDNIFNLIGNQSFENLMSALWKSLKSTAWEIDEHYKEFFENLANKTCTFCGINQLPNPESYRTDYDHLAYKGLYPISAINLKNIAPSCSECNSKFKLQKDILYNEDLITRRVFNYPYENFIDVQIDFNGTILPQTVVGNDMGIWNINFIPDNNFTNTWEYIYNIKQRYITEVLNVDYKTWIGEFKKELKEFNITINNYNDIKAHFLRHSQRYNEDRLQKRYIVKSSLFRYFNSCDNEIFYNQLIAEINA